MRYVYDHDYHIHSQLSACSSDPEQSVERILQYAKDNNLKQICLTDHFWDDAVPGASKWYAPQNYDHIRQALPLPQTDQVRFLFGCETDLDRFMTLGISPQKYDYFDFIIIPTTHLHMKGFTITEEDAASVEGRADCFIKRLAGLLEMPLPFHKIGIAHLTCGLIAPAPRENYLAVLNLLPEQTLRELFQKAAGLSVGIELNYGDMSCTEEEAATVLKPYHIAKQCGCKFYFGSDAHQPGTFDKTKAIFERAIDWLELKESDKFILTLD